MRIEMKKLKKAASQNPAPAAELFKTAEQTPAPAAEPAGPESYKPIAQPLPHVRPAESGPLLLSNVSDGSNNGPEKGSTFLPSDSTEDDSY